MMVALTQEQFEHRGAIMEKSVHKMHWLFFVDRLVPWLLAVGFLGGLFVLSGRVSVGVQVPRELYGLLRQVLIGIVFGGAILSILAALVQWISTTLTVEDGYLVYETGVLNRKVAKVPVQEIASIDLRQSLLQRVVKAGDLVIDMRGASLLRMKLLDDPVRIQNAVLSMRNTGAEL